MNETTLRKMRNASHLLPDPGGEVARQLLDEVERLQAAFHQHDVALALLSDGGIASQALFEIAHTLQSLPQEKWAAAIVKKSAQLAMQETAQLTANAGIERRAVGDEQGVAGSRVRSNDLLGATCLRSELDE